MQIPTPYFCTGQESESESVPESVSGNVNEPLQLLILILFPIDYVRFLYFQSYIKCKHVDYMSSRTEPFYDIQLNVKGKKNSEYRFTVNYTERKSVYLYSDVVFKTTQCQSLEFLYSGRFLQHTLQDYSKLIVKTTSLS